MNNLRYDLERILPAESDFDFRHLSESRNGQLSWLRVSCCLVLLCLCAFLVRPLPDLIPWSVGLIALSIFGLSALSLSSGVFFLGFTAMLLPMFRSGALEIGILSFLLATELKARFQYEAVPKSLLFVFQLILLAFVPALFLGVVESIDFLILKSVLTEGGIYGLYRWLLINREAWFVATQYYLSWFIFSFFAVYLSSLAQTHGKSVTDKLVSGLCLSAAASTSVLLLQISELLPLASFNRDPFFVAAGRFPATFADPNAFGVFAAVILPLLFCYSFSSWSDKLTSINKSFWSIRSSKTFSIMTCGVCVIFAISALWSGSRTFLVGMLSSLFLFGLRSIHQHSTMRPRLLALISLTLAASLVAISSPAINGFLQESLDLPGVERGLETISWESKGEGFKSRILFGRLAAHAWSMSPITGLGLGQFYDQQERITAEVLGSTELANLGGWRDNANNFFLQVLAETGLFGFVLLATASFIILRRCWIRANLGGNQQTLNLNTDDKAVTMGESQDLFQNHLDPLLPGVKLSLVVLVICLFTGPHFQFAELKFLFVVLCCILFNSLIPNYPLAGVSFSPRIFVFCWLLLAGIGLSSFSGEQESLRGFYIPERMPDGSREAWSGLVGEIELCEQRAVQNLEFRVAHPHLGTQPVSVVLHQIVDETEVNLANFKIDNHNWQSVQIPSSAFVKKTTTRSARASFRFSIDRLWSPLDFSPEADSRWLGIRLKIPENLCP